MNPKGIDCADQDNMTSSHHRRTPFFHIFSQKRWTATSYIIRATATCCILLHLLHLASLQFCLVSWPAPLSRLRNGTPVARTTKEPLRMWEGNGRDPNFIHEIRVRYVMICLYWCPVLLLLHLAWNPFQDMQQGKGCVLHTHLSHTISETQRLWCLYIYNI